MPFIRVSYYFGDSKRAQIKRTTHVASDGCVGLGLGFIGIGC